MDEHQRRDQDVFWTLAHARDVRARSNEVRAHAKGLMALSEQQGRRIREVLAQVEAYLRRLSEGRSSPSR